MKKTIFRAIICLATLTAMFISQGSVISSADGTHGFYMDCDSSVTGGKSDGFMIDFYSDSSDALATYWSNANWHMYTRETIKQKGYKLFQGGGAYAGLQITYKDTERKGIMSLWQYTYRGKGGETMVLKAKALYGDTTEYDNEGSGTSCVMPYDWKSSQWYRQLLYCWEDEETGDTLIGTWFYDYEADKWTLFAYYDTFLVGSYIEGGVSQFLENFVEGYRERVRSFRYRNIYFLPHDGEEWVSSPTVALRSDGNEKAMGEAKLGVSDDGTYVWASVDGTSAVDTDEKLTITTTLKQDQTPTLGVPTIKNISASVNKKNSSLTDIHWEMEDNSTPQLSYKLIVTDSKGNQLATKSGTRPEVTTLSLENLGEDYKCELSITDVFGKTANYTYTSENYGKDPLPSDPSDPSAPSGSSVPAEPSDSSQSDKDHGGIGTGTVIIIVAASVAAVVAVIGVSWAVVSAKKKKK